MVERYPGIDRTVAVIPKTMMNRYQLAGWAIKHFGSDAPAVLKHIDFDKIKPPMYSLLRFIGSNIQMIENRKEAKVMADAVNRFAKKFFKQNKKSIKPKDPDWLDDARREYRHLKKRLTIAKHRHNYADQRDIKKKMQKLVGKILSLKKAQGIL